MYTLYWSEGTGAFAPQVLLEEIGVAYKKIEFEFASGYLQKPEFLALNPMAEVPVLIFPEGTVMTETAAISIALADRHPDAGLSPNPTSSDRARMLRWLMFMAVNIYPACLRHHSPERYTISASQADGVRAQSIIELDRLFGILNAQLEPGQHILGDAFSIADPYALMLVQWHPHPEKLLSKLPALCKLCETVRERPAVVRIWHEHGFS